MIGKVWLFFCSDNILNKFDIGEINENGFYLLYTNEVERWDLAFCIDLI